MTALLKGRFLAAVFLCVAICGCEQEEKERMCSSGPCCDDNGQFKSANVLCGQTDEYRCSQSQCGGVPQSRTVGQHCSGVTAECDGDIDDPAWESLDNCAADQPCVTDAMTFAECRPCATDQTCYDNQCWNSVDWIIRTASGYSNNNTRVIAAFSDGSFVVVGHFAEWASFGDGEANETRLTSMGGDDIYMARYDADGSLMWAKSIGTVADDVVWDVAAFSDGSFLIVGSFLGAMSCPEPTDPPEECYLGMMMLGEGEPTETTLDNLGIRNGFEARYDADGALVWAKQISSSWRSTAKAIAIRPDDSYVISGNFNADIILGEGGPNETAISSTGGQSIFVLSRDSQGVFHWVVQSMPTDASVASGDDVDVASDGTIIVGGMYAATALFPKGNEFIPINGEGSYIAVFEPGGDALWVYYDFGLGIDLVPEFLALAVGPGDKIAVSAQVGHLSDVKHLNLAGEIQRETVIRGESGHSQAKKIALLQDGSMMTIGVFKNGLDFEEGDGKERVELSDYIHASFIARVGADGLPEWVLPYGEYLSCRDFAMLPDGSALVIGAAHDGATFGYNEYPFQTRNLTDAFVFKVSP